MYGILSPLLSFLPVIVLCVVTPFNILTDNILQGDIKFHHSFVESSEVIVLQRDTFNTMPL